MKRAVLVLVVAAVAAGSAVIARRAWWNNDLRRAASLASTPEQRTLWREAEARGLSNKDLMPLRLGAPPIQTKPSPGPARPPAASQAAANTLPAGVDNSLMLIASTERGEWQFDGDASVTAVSAERIDIQLDQTRRISVLARLNGRPLGAQPGQRIRVVIDSRPTPFEARDTLGLVAANGNLIASALRSGNRPVDLSLVLPTFRLTAQQSGSADNGWMTVRVDVNGSSRDIEPGRMEAYGASGSVQIVGSFARPVNARGEGSRFVLNLLAWRSGAPAP